MINIKATKAAPGSAEPSRERYTPKAEALLGKMPIHFAMILTAGVMYLQSFLRGAAAEDPARDDGQAGSSEPSAGAAIPDTELMAGPQPEQPAVADEPSIAATIHAEASSFVMLDSPALEFPTSSVAVRTDNGTFEFHPRSSNDNIGGHPSSRDASEGSGGGRGAQAGGRAHTDRGADAREDDDDDEDDDTTSPGNRAPRSSGAVLLGDFVSGQAALITFAALLQNSSDPDGDSLMIGDVAAKIGTITAVQGGFLYTAAADQTGIESISYTIRDTVYSTQQIARFQLVADPAAEAARMSDAAFTALPTSDSDVSTDDKKFPPPGGGTLPPEPAKLAEIDAQVLFGTTDDDAILGGSGNDEVFAGRGNDVVRAGAGADRVFGEDGNDLLFGEDGDDFLSGGEGNDHLVAGTGNDIVDGGMGEDVVDAGDGADIILATLDAANDIYDGGEGTDTLDLTSTQIGVIANLIAGTVTGIEIGMDVAVGIERILAGQGDDTVIVSNDTRENSYAGGAGTDTLDLSATQLGVLVDLKTGVAIGVEIGRDEQSGFETIFGGSGDDTFIVGTDAVLLRGGDGDDDFLFADISAVQSSVTHQIKDFRIGDRIYISDHFRISGEMAEDVKDLFEDIYGESPTSDRTIRYRNERVDEMDRTRIEADLDGDALYELAIDLDGHHVLFIADNIA